VGQLLASVCSLVISGDLVDLLNLFQKGVSRAVEFLFYFSVVCLLS